MSRTSLFFCLGIAIAVMLLLRQSKQASYDGEYVVPVRAHLLRATQLPAANCQLTVPDVRRIFAKVNRIWSAARIRIDVESVVDEPAEHQDSIHVADDAIPFAMLRLLRPVASCVPGLIHVYYLHRMSSNGVTQGFDAIFVQDTAALRGVPGGIDEPLPRVTAHELGHAFNLGHRESVTNLMASGTTAIALNEEEIVTARAAVAGYGFVHHAQ